MNSFGSPAVTPPFSSTTSSDTIDATDCVTTELRKAALGALRTTSKVDSSTTRVFLMVSARSPAFDSGRSIFRTRSQEYFTSSAVSALPSWNVTPSRIGNV
jgi:uncharacterized membrane protein